MAETAPIAPDPDETGFLSLERSLRLELDEPHWRNIGVGLLIHLAFIPFLFQMPAAPDAPRPAKGSGDVVRVFVAAAGRPEPPLMFHSLLHNSDLSRATPPLPGASLLEIDMSAVQLSFRPDVRNNLPAVAAAHGGVLALLDKQNPSIAKYILSPPSWRAEEVTEDVSGRLRLLMDPPQQWPVFRDAATQQGLNLNSFLACAIFDLAYRRCLQTAIQQRVPKNASGRVYSASLEFRSDAQCGVEATNVSLTRQTDNTR